MTHRIGIDVGGTFTDFLVIDDDGSNWIGKSPTTPASPSEGVFAGLEALAGERGRTLAQFLADTRTIVHGTTIATNAVLTGRGARVGFVTTEGFRDLLNMRRGLSESRYDWKRSPPPPLVRRHLIAPVRERIDVGGEVVVGLNEDDVRAAARLFRDEGIESVAVSFLWSFLNPSHEQRAAEILRVELGEVYLSLSSEVLPQIRAYERHSTTALNALVGPTLARYLEALQGGLTERGFAGTLFIMQSNGGVMAPEVATRFAVNTLLSGPAAGPVAGINYAGAHGFDDIITIDMGGTSFDVALVRGRAPNTTTEAQLGGYHVGVPMLDIHTVGAGGGSVARVDAGGILHVGPDSAGADPGPACYGRGGTQPTVTDADLVLGYLGPDTFAGGQLTLDVTAAERAIREAVANPLGIDLIDAAHGVYRIANTVMAEAVKVMSVQRGDDPRNFALIVAGGAGPIHAGPIAGELGIETLLIPRESSVFCAAGMLLSDLKHAFVRTHAVELSEIDAARAGQILDEMRAEAHATFEREGVAPHSVALRFSAELRYVGQFNEVEVEAFDGGIVNAATIADMTAAFHLRHDTLFGYAMADADVELINIRLTASSETAKPSLRALAASDEDPAHACRTRRAAYFEGGFREVDVFDGLKLAAGNRVPGPAIVEQPTTTIVIPPAYDMICDRFGNYMMNATRPTP